MHALNNYSCFIPAACFSAFLLQSLLIVSSSRPIPRTYRKGLVNTRIQSCSAYPQKLGNVNA